MSGEQLPVVDLFGTSMGALVQAIPITSEMTGRPVVVIGGLAVLCRLSVPYPVTSDLDAVDRHGTNDVGQLQLLLDNGATKSAHAVGVAVPTPMGLVDVDVLEVKDSDLDPLPEDVNDRLYATAHDWAARSASPMLLRAQGAPAVTVRVATPGPLVAMKLQSVMNRPTVKAATDLLDIVRLTFDQVAGRTAREELTAADGQLRQDAEYYVGQWFGSLSGQTLKWIHRIPEGAGIELDDVHLVGELLSAALRGQA